MPSGCPAGQASRTKEQLTGTCHHMGGTHPRKSEQQSVILAPSLLSSLSHNGCFSGSLIPGPVRKCQALLWGKNSEGFVAGSTKPWVFRKDHANLAPFHGVIKIASTVNEVTYLGRSRKRKKGAIT